MLPVFAEGCAATRPATPGSDFLVARPPHLPKSLYAGAGFPTAGAREVTERSWAALTKSGTITLELALCGCADGRGLPHGRAGMGHRPSAGAHPVHRARQPRGGGPGRPRVPSGSADGRACGGGTRGAPSVSGRRGAARCSAHSTSSESGSGIRVARPGSRATRDRTAGKRPGVSGSPRHAVLSARRIPPGVAVRLVRAALPISRTWRFRHPDDPRRPYRPLLKHGGLRVLARTPAPAHMPLRRPESRDPGEPRPRRRDHLTDPATPRL